MSANIPKNSFNLDPTIVLALLTVFGGVFLAAQRLSSDRPISQPDRFHDELTEQRYDTHLWEDPFNSIANGVDTNQLGDLTNDLHRVVTNNCEVRILQVMVPVDPSSENREIRTRIRYAVISALAQANYDPERPQTIGVWAITNWLSRVGDNKAVRDFYAPFEWYVPRENYVSRNPKTNKVKTLVLWLDEDSFFHRPYYRLQSVFTHLTGAVKDKSKLHLVTIGPYYSSTLRDLISDVDSKMVPDETNFRQSELIIAISRAVDELVVSNRTGWIPNDPMRRNVINALTKNQAFSNVINVSLTDWSIAGEVFRTLKERGVDLANPRQHMVLLADEDQFVGQTIERTYAWRMESDWHESIDLSADSLPRNLHVYSFLEGIDGQPLSIQPRSDFQSTNRDSHSVGTWKFDVNRAEGPNQLDYLERLAGRIERLQIDLAQTNGGKVDVIGIGPTDVYDTLLILQALRPHFPDAIFFTTQLDARLWQPQEWEWTHNLLIFSGYGLGLKEEFQSKVGDFRDSTQTAMYTATLAAFGGILPTNFNDFADVPPRTFEIARTGPLDLSRPSPPSPIHPVSQIEATQHFDFEGSLLIAFLLISIFALVVLLSPKARSLILESDNYLAEPLFFREEDIGGFRGLWHLKNAVAVDAKTSRHMLSQRYAKIFESIQNDKSFWRKLMFMPEDITSPAKIAGLLMLKYKDLLYDALKFKSRIPDEEINREDWQGLLAIDIAGKFNRLIDPKGGKHDLIKLYSNAALAGRDLKAVNSKVASSDRDLKRRIGKAQWLLRQSTLDLLASEPVAPQQLQILRRMILQDLFAGMVKPMSGVTLLFENVHNLLEEINCKLLTPIRNDVYLCDPKAKSYEVVDNESLSALIGNRRQLDRELRELLTKYKEDAMNSNKNANSIQEEERRFSVPTAATYSRKSAWSLYDIRRYRIAIYKYVLLPLFGLVTILTLYWWLQRLPIENGGALGATSAVPTIFMCAYGLLLAVAFIFESWFQLEAAEIYTSRLFRLSSEHAEVEKDPTRDAESRSLPKMLKSFILRASLPSVPAPLGLVEAKKLWVKYNEKSQKGYRTFRTVRAMACYLVAFICLMFFLGEDPRWTPHLVDLWIRVTYLIVVWLLLFLFLFLTFWTIDAACLCRWFIKELTQGPTEYPEATLKHFGDVRARNDPEALAEYIDVRIIAEITERVGVLLFFPAIILFILLVAHNTLTFVWPWRPAWLAVTFCHFIVAILSMLILQDAAKRARDASVQSLEAKLQQIRAANATTERERSTLSIDDGERLLEEIKSLRAGAFAGFAGNPILGALLVPSGGTVILELIRYFLGK